MPKLRLIRLLIIVPHDMMRASLHSFISSCNDIVTVGEAKTGSDALQLCEQLQPDAMLLSHYLPDMGALTVTHMIKQKPNPPYIVLLDGLLGEEHERAALKAGADAYFTVDIPVHVMVDAIYAA